MIEDILLPQVCERFKTDERYRMGHLRVINALPRRRVLGMHTPEMKKTAQELWLNKNVDYIKVFEGAVHNELTYEETVIWGFLINKGKRTLEERLAMLASFVPVLDNWAVCDSYCANAKWMQKADKEKLWSFICGYFLSNREFEVRFAVIAALCYFLNEEWVERVFEKIDTINFDSIISEYVTEKSKQKKVQAGIVQGTKPYYVRMAVAWFLATALAKLPDATRNYIRGSHLPLDVINMYVRKVRESYRTREVSPF